MTTVPIKAYLVDEPHFIVSVRACSGCGQRYLQVTTETIDWRDGDDPGRRTVVPIDDDEWATLQAARPVTREVLERIGRDRISLTCDAPKGPREQVLWGTGLRIGPHD